MHTVLLLHTHSTALLRIYPSLVHPDKFDEKFGYYWINEGSLTVCTYVCTVKPARPPVQKDHLSVETTAGWSKDHLSDAKALLYKDYLSTETTITWSLEWSS
jgi:hypothetical protein